MRWLLMFAVFTAVARGEDIEKEQAKLRKVTPAAVNKAIDAGIAWLKAKQDERGSWGPCTSSSTYGGGAGGAAYHTGPTSFSLFTLLKCGVSKKDKVIKKGLKWLRERCRKSWDHTKKSSDYRFTSYESASVILMLTALHDPGKKKQKVAKRAKKPPPGSRFKRDDWEWMHERVSHLAVRTPRVPKCQNRNGGWGYWTAKGYEDTSATQFALLALREAVRVGYPLHRVAPDTFRDALFCCQRLQLRSGAFVYEAKGYPWSSGMTAAGVASLRICKEQLTLQGVGVPEWVGESIGSGLEHMGRCFDVSKNSFDPSGGKEKHRRSHYHYYHLYGLERVGALTGKREFGGKAWYTRGAAYLLSEQYKAGKWVDRACMAPRDVLGTCFALLFLKRATIPTVTISGD